MFKFRILPMAMLGAIAVLGLQIDEIRRSWPQLAVGEAFAKEAEGKDAAANDNAEKAGDKASADTGKPDSKPAGGKADGMAKDADASRSSGKAKMAAQESQPDVLNGTITQSELEVLQSLAKRREEWESRGEELRLRENVLAATEKRIDKKIDQLKDLEKQIEKLLGKHDKEKEEQLKSLVKVYESMKPKDAARIFEKLEMDILLKVTARMREAKMAPVLAQMDPEKAKELTVELANQSRLPGAPMSKKKAGDG